LLSGKVGAVRARGVATPLKKGARYARARGEFGTRKKRRPVGNWDVLCPPVGDYLETGANGDETELESVRASLSLEALR
jgi:hypothetical protein